MGSQPRCRHLWRRDSAGHSLWYDYSLLLSAHKNELDPRLVAITSDAGVLDELNDKSRFYALCERAGVPYPRCCHHHGSDDIPDDLPFPFPVCGEAYRCGPSATREHEFEGQKKAFITETAPCWRRRFAASMRQL